jgi:hypothetical protein
VTLIANDTTADGVQDAQRQPGAAVISMRVGAVASSVTANAVIMVNTGAGLTNNTSGDISSPVVIGASMLLVNDGLTPGSSITGAFLSPGFFNQVAVGSVALDVNGAGGGGNVNATISPFSPVVNVTARASGIIAFGVLGANETYNIGNAALGGLTGLSTTGNNGFITFGGGPEHLRHRPDPHQHGHHRADRHRQCRPVSDVLGPQLADDRLLRQQRQSILAKQWHRLGRQPERRQRHHRPDRRHLQPDRSQPDQRQLDTRR